MNIDDSVDLEDDINVGAEFGRGVNGTVMLILKLESVIMKELNCNLEIKLVL